MFVRKTTASVLKSFTKAIADLDIVVKQSLRDIDDAEIEIKEANDDYAVRIGLANNQRDDASTELNKAHSVKAKLEALLS